MSFDLSIPHLDLDTLDVLRLLLSGTLAVSSWATFRIKRQVAPALRPHFLLISIWSAVNCVLMMTLVTADGPTLGVLQMLNVSSILLLGSWSLLMVRLSHALSPKRIMSMTSD